MSANTLRVDEFGTGTIGRPMSAKLEDPQETDRFSWEDVQWFEHILEDEFLTRPQLVEKVRARGVEVDERSLVFWERKKILPRPIKRGREVVYPPRAVDVVTSLRQLQESGLTLDAIRALMHEHALANAQIRVGDPLRAALRFNALRIAATKEQEKGLAAGAISSVTIQFKDAAGDIVDEEDISWSERYAVGVRENPDLVPWEGLRKRPQRQTP